MKLLVVSQHYWPETFRITDVVHSLRQRGVDVRVLTGQPNYPEGQVFPGYSAWSTALSTHDGTPVYRVPLVPRGKGGALRLILNYLSFIVSASVCGTWMLRRERIDVVFVYATSPLLQAIAAIWIARVKRAQVVTWVQDLWPESLEATGFVRNRMVLHAVASVVRWIYRHNDLLLVQSREFIETTQAMSGGTPVAYHPNPAELTFATPTHPDEKPALLLGAGFNVVFAGNLGTVQALDTLLNAADSLRTHRDIRLVLIGTGSRSDWCRQEVARRGLHNVQLTGRFSPEQMPSILAQASALLVSLVRSQVMSQTIPSKIQAYLAAGRPVIASMDGAGAAIVMAAGAGVACPAEDAPALAAAVLALRDATPDARQRMGMAGRRYFEQHFDPDVLAARLIERFKELTANR